MSTLKKINVFNIEGEIDNLTLMHDTDDEPI